eukprot:6840786-Pyramimonas_sp.AAC.1
MAFDFIDAKRPRAFLLENVKELGQVIEDQSLSDKDWIVKEFKAAGYSVSAHVYDACSHGAQCRRKRLWFCGVQAKSLDHGHELLRNVRLSMHNTVIAPIGWSHIFGDSFGVLDDIN